MSTEDVNHVTDIIGDGNYQEKVVQSLLVDHEYADQMCDVLHPDFFSQDYLKEIVSHLFNYRQKYNSFPSIEILQDIIKRKTTNELIESQTNAFIAKIKQHPLNGDAGYIRDTSIDFCRKMSIKEGMMHALDALADNNFDSIVKIIMDSVVKGASRDMGHDYMQGFARRSEKSIRAPVATPWPVLNKIFGGGWERKTLSTFIAPTGAGKTHFLCNVSAGGIEMGHNVCYISMEIADYKIGIRHDAYFSGINIGHIPDETERVQKEAESKVKGRLFIKEFPTKMASVQTIRTYLNRLKAMNNFVPDIVVIDYADLLRSAKTYGERRHDLESVYEELRGLAQEMNLVVITADQTNRSGLNAEIITLEAIAESYAKATVCDLILTISRKVEDKKTNSGRLFIAKSRLGPDGIVYPFLMDPAKVKVRILDQTEEVEDIFSRSKEQAKETLKNRFDQLMSKKVEKD